jgi:succinate dehydrogenase/fumarate reductase flavoprotein subunit
MSSVEKNQKELTRRDFVKGATAGAVGGLVVGAAGTALSAQKAQAKPQLATKRDKETDVLVVGMGWAGVVTALRAAEQGVKVTFIDKQPKGWWVPGGDMLISGQSIHIAGRNANLTQEELFKICNDSTGRRAIPKIIDAYVKNIPRGFSWLMGNGVEFEEPAGQERTLKPVKPSMVWGEVKPGAVYDAAKYGGKITANHLLSLFEKKGGKALYSTKAEKLLTNDKGEVIGIIAKDKDGQFKIRAKSVILTTGGFVRNNELKVRYMGPQADYLIPYVNPGATGDGLLMALELGAATRTLSYTAYYPCIKDCIWNEDLIWETVPFTEALVFDGNGERLADESNELKAWGAKMIGGGYGQSTGLIVFDKTIYDKKYKKRIDTIVKKGGTVYTADTLPELALKAGVNLHMVVEIEEFNKAVDEGKVAYLKVPKKSSINKIDTPPFYGAPFAFCQISSMGGLLTNAKGEVLTCGGDPGVAQSAGDPIPGLYAAGNVALGTVGGGIVGDPSNAKFHGPAYIGNLLICLVFGLLAAENAAARAKA